MSKDPFDILRALAGDPTPTEADVSHTWARLQAAIVKEQTRTSRRRLLPVAVAAAMLVAVVSVLVVTRPTRVEAALGEIAAAARTATPQEIPDGSFLYIRNEGTGTGIRPGDELGLADHWAIQIPIVRQVWRQGDFEQVTTTYRTPRFFDPNVEAAYYAHDLDLNDHIGQTITQQFTGITNELTDINWPTDPDQLRRALDNYLQQSHSELPLDVQVFKLATELLRETDPGPALRSALVQVFAQLPMTLVDRTPDGTVTLAITYDNQPRVRDTITLNPHGYLIAETETYLQATPVIPADTIVSTITYSIPTITTTLDTP